MRHQGFMYTVFPTWETIFPNMGITCSQRGNDYKNSSNHSVCEKYVAAVAMLYCSLELISLRTFFHSGYKCP